MAMNTFSVCIYTHVYTHTRTKKRTTDGEFKHSLQGYYPIGSAIIHIIKANGNGDNCTWTTVKQTEKNKGKKATIWVCVEGRKNSNHRNELWE